MKKLLILLTMMLMMAGMVYAGDVSPTVTYSSANPADNERDTDGSVTFSVDTVSNMTQYAYVILDSGIGNQSMSASEHNTTWTLTYSFTEDSIYEYYIVATWVNETVPLQGNLSTGSDGGLTLLTDKRQVRIDVPKYTDDYIVKGQQETQAQSTQTQSTISFNGKEYPQKTVIMVVAVVLGLIWYLGKKK